MQNNDIDTLNIHSNGIWGCEKDSVTMIEGQAESFHRTDKSLLDKVADATPNPLASG